MQRAAYCPRTDEVSSDVGPLHLEGAPAAGELRVVGDIGGVIKSGVVEADEVSVLGGLDVRLDEVGALVDGAHVRLCRLLGAMLKGRDVCSGALSSHAPPSPTRGRAATPPALTAIATNTDTNTIRRDAISAAAIAGFGSRRWTGPPRRLALYAYIRRWLEEYSSGTRELSDIVRLVFVGDFTASSKRYYHCRTDIFYS